MQSIAPFLSLKWLTKDKIGRILIFLKYAVLLISFLSLVIIFRSVLLAIIEVQTYKLKLTRIVNPPITVTESSRTRDVDASMVASKLNLSEPQVEQEEKEEVPPPDLRLVGTIVLANLPRVAIIENKGGGAAAAPTSFGQAPYGTVGAPVAKAPVSTSASSGKGQESFAVGDVVFGYGKLQTVEKQYVEIKGPQGTIKLKLEDMPEASSSSSEDGSQRIVVASKDLDAALENLPLLLSQARAVPYFKEGKSIGLRLFAIRPGSLYEKIGLLNGDILKAVNDKSLGDFREAVMLFDKLKAEKSIVLDLERNLNPLRIRYSIK